jgi:hypothetical protein
MLNGDENENIVCCFRSMFNTNSTVVSTLTKTRSDTESPPVTKSMVFGSQSNTESRPGFGPRGLPTKSFGFGTRILDKDERARVREVRCQTLSNKRLANLMERRLFESFGKSGAQVATASDTESIEAYERTLQSRPIQPVESDSSSDASTSHAFPLRTNVGGDGGGDGGDDGDDGGYDDDDDDYEDEVVRNTTPKRNVKVPLKTVFMKLVSDITAHRKLKTSPSTIITTISPDLPNTPEKLGKLMQLAKKGFGLQPKIEENIDEIHKFDNRMLSLSLFDIANQTSDMPFKQLLGLLDCVKNHCELCLEMDDTRSVAILKDAICYQFGKC